MRKKTDTIYHIENIFCGEKTSVELYKEFIKKVIVLEELAIDDQKIDNL